MIRFGTLADGRAVHAVEIGTGPLKARLLSYGAILQDVRLAGVPDRSLTLGSDRLADYEDDLIFFGPVVGPVANRLRGAQAPLGAQMLTLAPNTPAGHLLHSGPEGTVRRLWDITDSGPDHAELAVALRDGDCGMPGARRIVARFETEGAVLRMRLTASTDAPTLMNLANHSFWNLDGTPTFSGHALRIAADSYLPTDADTVPTGEIADVTGTAFDFRGARTLTPGDPPLDCNFCLSRADAPLRPVLWLSGRTGVSMTLATTAPGLQVFDQRGQARPGRERHEGLAIEPQGWPDAPNNPGFPSIELRPGDSYEQLTEWRFATG